MLALSFTLPLDHFFFLAGTPLVQCGWEGGNLFCLGLRLRLLLPWFGDGGDGESGFVVEKRAVPEWWRKGRVGLFKFKAEM